MQKDERLAFSGGLDMDSDELLVANGNHTFAMNAIFSRKLKVVLDTLGNDRAGTYTLPAGAYIIVGALDAGNYIFYALTNQTTIHRIIRFNVQSEVHDMILSETFLNFGAGSFVKMQYNESNDTLYWTDGRFGSFTGNASVPLGHNPPRTVNVDKAFRYYDSGGSDPLGYSSMTEQHLDVIKYPSSFPLTCGYVTDESFNTNLIKGKMLQFSLQYVYEDNTVSVWTIWSRVALPTISESDEALDSLEDNVIAKFQNSVEVTFNTGHETVKKIRIAVRDGNTGVVGVFKELVKSELGYGEFQEKVINYRGDEGVSTVSFDDLYNYSLVPITANDNIFASSGDAGISLIYGGIREGFDKEAFDVDLQVHAHKLFDGHPWAGILNYYFNWREVIQRRPFGGSDTILDFIELNIIPLEHLLFESFAFKIDMTYWYELSDSTFGLFLATADNFTVATSYGSMSTMTESFDTGGNVALNVFTAPYDGIFTFQLWMTFASTGTGSWMQLILSDGPLSTDTEYYRSDQHHSIGGANILLFRVVTLSLLSGSQVYMNYKAAGGSDIIGAASYLSNSGTGFALTAYSALNSDEDVFIEKEDINEALGAVDTSTGSAAVFAYIVRGKLAALGYTGLTLLGDTISSNKVSSGVFWIGSMNTYTPRRSSFKKGDHHPIGVVYYDRGKRDGGVIDVGDVYVPFDKEIYDDGLWNDNVTPVRTTIKALLSHQPPAFAEYYSLVYQGAKLVDSFERRIIMGINPNISGGLVRLYLENWHEVAFDQAGDFTAHEIKVGDVLRIVRGKEDIIVPYSTPPFVDYEEYDVKAVSPSGDPFPYVDIMLPDAISYYAGVINSAGANSGMMVEILSQKKQLESAPYFSMGKVYPIIDPHLSTRVHGGETVSDIPCEQVKGTLNYVDLYGDYSWLSGGLGDGVTMTISGSVGNNGTYVISAVVVNNLGSIPISRLFTLTSGMTTDDGVGNTARVEIVCNQALSGGGTPAIAWLDHGDVYCRQTVQRFRVTIPTSATPSDRNFNEWSKPYWIESFHYTDKYISNSYDKGNPYAELSSDQGHQYNWALIRNSLNFVEGTLINGLSSFLSPNQKQLSQKDGPISRMVVSGYTLKVLQSDKNTSVYLSRQEIANADGSNQLVTINKILGSSRPDKQPYGTTHPYSVVQVDSDTYYIDQKRKAVIKDTPGGQVLISGIGSGVNSFWNVLTNLISSNVAIVGGHDRRNGLVFFSVTKKGSAAESFTITYDYVESVWRSFYGFTTGMFVTAEDDRFYCFNGANLYEMNVGNPREFFEVYSDFYIDKVCNPFNTVKKVFDCHEVASSEILEINPITIPADPENVNGMTTIMSIDSQEINEGTVFGAYKMDRNSPGFGVGQGDWAMIEGRPMRGLMLKHRYLKTGEATEQITIKHAIVRFTPSEPI